MSAPIRALGAAIIAAGLAVAFSAAGQVATPFSPVTAADLAKPAGAEWLTYHGDYSARHYSGVAQINLANVGKLKRAWVSRQPGVPAPQATARRAGGLPRDMFSPGPAPVGAGRTGTASAVANSIRSIPLMHDGVLFFTIGAHAYAIDARTGGPLWDYTAESSSNLSNRGLALSGDSLFMMANGGLTALDARTGKERWRRPLDGPIPASAPVAIRKHVYVSVGSDGKAARSWLESRNADSGEREWIWYGTPRPGEAGAETWPDEAAASAGVGTPWQPLAYDPAQNLIFVGTGNPGPMKDGRTRPGDNLWSSSIVALDADTGKMAWYFQLTPHDDHDYDANQVTMLFDAKIAGVNRHLLGLVGRNGFLFVIDRTTGKSVTTSKIFANTNWTRFVRPGGAPEPDPAKSPSAAGVLVSPSSEGVTNYPASAFSPQTGLIYSNVVNSWSLFYISGETFMGDFRNSLRAFDPATGKAVWTHDYQEPYGVNARYPGVLATAGGLVFTGDVSGNIVAFNAKSGVIVWHDELPQTLVTNAPMSYVLDGKQYVVVGTGDRLVAYTLP